MKYINDKSYMNWKDKIFLLALQYNTQVYLACCWFFILLLVFPRSKKFLEYSMNIWKTNMNDIKMERKRERKNSQNSKKGSKESSQD